MKIYTHIKVVNSITGKVRFYEVHGSGDLRKAAYCYEIGDDLYESGDDEVKRHTEVLDEIPDGCIIVDHRIFVNEGRVE